MKRRYKRGDWLRVPLGGEFDALGIIARACRSRLFGYFFAVPSSHIPAHDELRAFRPEDAIAALLFGGAALEHARWDIVAASLAFDSQAWPFPEFASRGAFGDSWTQVRYDADTLQIVERRRIDREAAAALPDAAFANAQDVEAILRRKIYGESMPGIRSVVEVRSPIDFERLRVIEGGGRIQFSTALTPSDAGRLAAFVNEHPQVTLRVHGFRHGFDAGQLARFTQLRDLSLDVHHLQHADALRALGALRVLRMGAVRTNLDFLQALNSLQTLDLRGTRGNLDAVLALADLRTLVLEGTVPVPLRSLRSAGHVQTLVLSHGTYDTAEVHFLANLRNLELRALETGGLPALRRLALLERLELHALVGVTDLSPIALAPALRRLRITAMPQLTVDDFRPLQRCESLRSFDVEIGSRRKEREIYRLMKRGNTYEL